jgi:uncharacterized protein YciI
MDFIYKLILIDRLFKEDNWTDEDEAIVGRHYNHLVSLKEKGKLVLAGKTSGLDKDTYGIVIFQADNLDDAKVIMENDPAIKEGIMTGHLQGYDVALITDEYKK